MTTRAAVRYHLYSAKEISNVCVANFYNGARRLNIQAPKDPNAGDATGIFRLERSVHPKTQTRSTARINHYDRIAASRPNYHILPSTAGARIVFQGTAAVGVEYVSIATGETAIVKASKEVIVAAGSVHSPQILQLSGIGDAAHLKSLGIKSVVDLPGVGQNLQDHLVLKVKYNCEFLDLNSNANTDSLQTRITSSQMVVRFNPTPPTPLSKERSTTRDSRALST